MVRLGQRYDNYRMGETHGSCELDGLFWFRLRREL